MADVTAAVAESHRKAPHQTGYSAKEKVRKYDPRQPRDKEGKWTESGGGGRLLLQGKAKVRKPDILSTGAFEEQYPEERRLYTGVPSAGAAERIRTGRTGLQTFQSIANAQNHAQDEERGQGIVVRMGIKHDAFVSRVPRKLQFADREKVIQWAKENKVDIVNIDDLEYIVMNPAAIAVDSHDYTLTESTVLEYERNNYRLEGHEAEKATLAALRQAKDAPTADEPDEIPLHHQARALIQHAVGAEIPVGVDDHPVALRAAQEVATVLAEMKAKGYKLPREVEVRAQQGGIPHGEATHDILQIWVPDNLPDDVSLDDAVLTVYGDVDYDGTDRYVPRTFQQVVVHEMGHINRREANNRENEAARKEFEREMKAIHQMERIAKQVSWYAAQNADEFVAEVFTKLYRGDKVSPAVMRVYRGLRGAPVK